MVANNFYVHISPLSDNTDENPLVSFTATLPKTLQFTSNWTVALTNIVFKKSWCNLGTRSLEYILVHWQHASPTFIFVRPCSLTNAYDLEHLLTSQIREGQLYTYAGHGRIVDENGDAPQFLNPADLLQFEIPDSLGIVSRTTPPYDRLEQHVQMRYDSLLERFVFKFTETEIHSLEFSEQLANSLGLLENRVDESRLADLRPDLSAGVSTLFIYTPALVVPSIQGSRQLPLLRAFKVDGEAGSVVEHEFRNPQYRQLSDKQIRQISVQFCDSCDRSVNIASDDCLLTLHFRKQLF